MYLPITSISKLTLSPLDLSPKVVIASVWGIKTTEIVSPLTSTTVRLMPSMASDPLGTIAQRSSYLGLL